MLQTVLDSTVVFSLLFAGVWLVKRLFRKQLSARMHYAIWAVVVIAMLIPAKIGSDISLWNLLPRQRTEPILQQVQGLQAGIAGTIQSMAGNPAGSQTPNNPAPDNSLPITQAPQTAQMAQPTFANDVLLAALRNWPFELLAVWLAGVFATALRLLLGSAHLRRQVLRCGLPEAPPLLAACMQECMERLGLRRNVGIVLQPVLPVPAAMGVFHPVLAIPESIAKECDGDRVRHILMHELVHVKRGDLFVIAAINILTAVYWFNPLVWLCSRCVRADMETSCDNDVLEALGRSRRQEYIRTLVYYSGMEAHSCARTALSLHDARIKLKKRIGGMYMTKKTKLSITVPVLLLILVLLVAAFAAGCVPMANAVENSATQGTGTASAQQTETPTPANTTAPAAVATLVSPTSSPSPTATAPTQSPAEPPSPKATATTAATAKGSETLYKNTEYGFQLDLPQDWKGYTVVNDQWKGTDSATGKTVETGPQFLIRNPKWTDQKPYQDIPVMVFTLKQWDTMQKDGFHIGAAPINPSELGRNGSYVFALPARYNYAYPTGWEEVEQYLNTKPLQTFNASK